MTDVGSYPFSRVRHGIPINRVNKFLISLFNNGMMLVSVQVQNIARERVLGSFEPVEEAGLVAIAPVKCPLPIA